MHFVTLLGVRPIYPLLMFYVQRNLWESILIHVYLNMQCYHLKVLHSSSYEWQLCDRRHYGRVNENVKFDFNLFLFNNNFVDLLPWLPLINCF